MIVLGFERNCEIVEGKRVRRMRFERRSLLPVSAACVVANGVRETLSSLFAVPVVLRLLEPVIPDGNGWSAISDGAQIFRARGPACDAAFILRRDDALALAASAFGEEQVAPRALSPVEGQVLYRILRALAGSLPHVCGRETGPLERILDVNGYVTYFELLLERPLPARIGVALSRDPTLRGAATLRIEDLREVEIALTVEFARGEIGADAFLGLRPGANVPMKTRIGESGRLKLGGAVLAAVECGAVGERTAIRVTAVP